MQITLNQKEIEAAIIAFVGNQGISITGKNVLVEMTAGRGANGMSAAISISNDGDPAIPKMAVAHAEVVTDREEGTATNPVFANPPTEEVSEDTPLFGRG